MMESLGTCNKSSGANVLGGRTNNDCPNNGNTRPAESATICWNSVSGQGAVFGCGICEGLSGIVRERFWPGLEPVGAALNCGMRSEGDGYSRPWVLPGV